MKPPVRKVVYPRHPAHLDPYVDVLGPELAVRFLLRFGGTERYFPNTPGGRSEMEALVGAERLRDLSHQMAETTIKIPNARLWLAHALAAEGLSKNDIARAIGREVSTVRKMLKRSPHGASHPAEGCDTPPESPTQLSLF